MSSAKELEAWPPGDLEAVSSCPVCGSAERTELYKALGDRVYYAAPGSWNLHRCGRCGIAYLDPRPTPASIGRAYASYCTHEPAARDRESDTPVFRRWLRRALRNGYINRRYGSSLSPGLSIGALLVAVLPWKKTQIDLDLRYLPRKRGAGARVLDIGCGNGSFLSSAQQLGWESHGVDTDPEAVAHGIGSGARLGGFPSIDFPDNYFDAITLSHVIEHVHDPVGAMREVFRLLKPGGQVTLITPNLEGIGHRQFGANWIGLHPPAHLVLFTVKSLETTLQASGFSHLRFRHVHGQIRESFGFSARIKRGARPFAELPTPLPFSLGALACAADLAALAVPRLRENIVVTARSPQ